MALKVLGQSNPSADTLTSLYACAATKFVVMSIFVCNQSSTPATVYVYGVYPDLSTFETNLIDQLNLDGNSFGVISNGFCGDTGGGLYCRASTANVSFSAFGDES